MIYVLSSAQQIFSVTVRVQESRQGDGAAAANLALNMKQHLSSEVFDEQQRYLNNAAIAAYVSFNKIDQRNRFKASVSLSPQLSEDNYSFIEGSSSSGLGYALSLFDAWWHEVLAKPSLADSTIFCTGEIGRNGEIKPISYQNEKIRAAIRLTEAQQISAFTICLPKANENDVPSELKEQAIASGGRLIFADRLQTLLGTLYGDAYDGDPLGRWEAFKGLKSFNYEDSIRFFGRDKDTQRLLNDLQSNEGILIVSGQSGSGKSSLVKAGLIPQLEKTVDHLKWVTTTPKEVPTSFLDDLLTHLAKGAPENNPISPLQIIQGLLEDTLDVSSVAHFVADNAVFLYHIDQFEELYTTDIGQKAEAQLSALQRLTQLNKRIKVVLSIRNEYLPILLELGEIKSPVISNVSGNLDYAAWQAIVLEQAAFSGYEFEQQKESLAHEIIDDALNTPNSLPMVEFVLQQLAEQAKQSDQPTLLTHHAYQAMGRLVGAIAQRADEVIDVIHTDPITIHHFFSLFVGTTTDGLPFAKRLGYKNSGIEVDQPLNDIIKRAIDTSILISASNLADGVELKLAHDCLFNHWNALNQWLSDQKAFLQWRNAVDYGYQQWANDQKSIYLIDDARLLNQGLNFIKKNLIAEPKLIAYVKRSKGRKRNRLLSILGLLLLIALAISLYFYDQYRIKIEYHSAIAEKWSVPYGIRPLDEETVKHRTGSYKLEYQNGRLRSLSFVNSYGTPIPDQRRDNNGKWVYSYTESGQLNSITAFDPTGKTVYQHEYKFDGQQPRAMVTFNKSFLSTDFKALQSMPDPLDESGDSKSHKSPISKQLINYSSEGHSIRIDYLNIHGEPALLSNKYSSLVTSFNDDGQPKTVNYRKNTDSIATDPKGVVSIEYEYGAYNELIGARANYGEQKALNYRFSLDSHGNRLGLVITDDQGLEVSRSNHVIRDNGLVTETAYEFSIIPSQNENPRLAKVQLGHDDFGRIVSIDYLDQHSKPIEQDASRDIPYLPSGAESMVKSVGTLRIEYNPTGLIRSIDAGQQKATFDYDQSARPIRLSARNSSNELVPLLPPDMPVITANGQDTITITSINFRYDTDGVISELGMVDDAHGKFLALRSAADKQGNSTSKKLYFNDLPAASIFFPHKEVSKYDEMGNLIDSSYYDLAGNPTTHLVIGCASVKSRTDKHGRKISEACFDEQGSKHDNNLGFHLKEISYAEDDDYVQSTAYYDNLSRLIYPAYVIAKANHGSKVQVVLPSEVEPERVYIDSEPSGALIYIEDELIGVTPLKHRPKLSQFDFKLVKDGYDHVYASYEGKPKSATRLISKILDEGSFPYVIQQAKELFNANHSNFERVEPTLIDAVEQAYAPAATLLFKIYRVMEKYDQAREMLFRAAEMGDPVAQSELAAAYMLSNRQLEIDVNLDNSLFLARLASEQKNGQGSAILANFYKEANNINYAIMHFIKSCNEASAMGCYFAAVELEKLRNHELALKYYMLASDLRYNDANLAISLIQRNHFVYPYNLIKSLRYAYKAWEGEKSLTTANWIAIAHDQMGDYVNSSYWYDVAISLNERGLDLGIIESKFSKKGFPANYYNGFKAYNLINKEFRSTPEQDQLLENMVARLVNLQTP